MNPLKTISLLALLIGLGTGAKAVAGGYPHAYHRPHPHYASRVTITVIDGWPARLYTPPVWSYRTRCPAPGYWHPHFRPYPAYHAHRPLRSGSVYLRW